MAENDFFDGIYFDGLTAKARQIKLSFEAGTLLLEDVQSGDQKLFYHYNLSHFDLIGKERILIRLNDKTGELIDVSSKEFISAFQQKFPKIKERGHILEKIAQSGWKGFVSILTGLIVLVLLLYFFVIPGFAEFSVRFIPKSYEEQFGKTLFGNFSNQYTIDSAKTKLLNEMMKETDFQTGYNLNVVVVNEDMKNAFALPGGYIIVFSGIINEMNDYSELMALMGHEVSHVNHRHSLRSIFRALSSYLFVSILIGDMSGISAILVDNLNSIRNLSYSRSLETEADKEGLKILMHNNYDPNGMVKLFEQLMKDSPIPDEMEFLSTHPLSEKRIDHIKELIDNHSYNIEENSRMDSLWIKLKE